MARLADPVLADRRRRQILDAAIGCFRRRGFHQSTMHEICAEANISAGALYRYFSSKAEIIAAIAEDRHSDTELQFLATARKLGVVDALSLVARAFFERFADGDGALFADIYAESIRDADLAHVLHTIGAKSRQDCIAAIEAGQKGDEVDSQLDANAATDTLFAAIQGIGLRRAFLRDTDPAAAVAEFRTLAERFLSPRP